MFDPLNQNGDDEIDFSEKNLFEGLPVDEICKNTVDFPEEEFKKPEKGEEEKEEDLLMINYRRRITNNEIQTMNYKLSVWKRKLYLSQAPLPV